MDRDLSCACKVAIRRKTGCQRIFHQLPTRAASMSHSDGLGILIDLVGDREPRFKPGPNVRYGSKADIPRPSHLCPLPGVKRTSNVRFWSPTRSGASECPLWVESGRSRHDPKESAYSQKRTFTANSTTPICVSFDAGGGTRPYKRCCELAIFELPAETPELSVQINQW